MAKGTNKEICLFVFCFTFTVSVTPGFNAPRTFNNLMILVISFISSFQINIVNAFPALAASFLLIIFLNFFLVFEVKSLTNPDKLSLDKRIAIFLSVLFPKLTNQGPKDPPG